MTARVQLGHSKEDTWYDRQSKRSQRLVREAIALLDEEQRDRPQADRRYPLNRIVEATVKCDREHHKGIKLSTLRRNSDVDMLVRTAKGEDPIPTPDFSYFGAYEVEHTMSERNQRRRAQKFKGMTRAKIAYFVVGLEELDRHLENLRNQIEAVDWPDGLWPSGVIFPNMAFEASLSAVHRYRQLSTRQTISALQTMLRDVQQRVAEHQSSIDSARQDYMSQLELS